MVAGCLAQKDREGVTDRAPYVDVVLGTHNVHRAAELLEESRTEGRSIVEILEETVASDHDAFPSALPVRREVPLGRRGSRSRSAATTSCAFCIVPAVRGKEISRPFDDIVHEVDPRGRRRRHRGHPARPEREQLRPRPRAGRPAGRRRHQGAADVRRAAPGRRRRRRHPSGPLHEPAPEGPPGRDDRGDGRDARDVRAPPPAAAVRQRPGAGRHAPRLHRGALPRAAGGGPSRHPRPGRHHRPHRRLPRRDRRRLRAHPRGRGRSGLRQRLHVHLQPPPWHRGRRAASTSSSPRGRGRALRTAQDRARPLGSGPPRGTGRHGSRRCWSRAPPARTPPSSPVAPARTSWCTSAPSPSRPGSYATVRITGAAPHHLRGDLVEVTVPAAHKTRLPLLVG